MRGFNGPLSYKAGEGINFDSRHFPMRRDDNGNVSILSMVSSVDYCHSIGTKNIFVNDDPGPVPSLSEDDFFPISV